MDKQVVTNMRRFYVVRSEDVSGVSGTGKVAEGIEFSDGTCAVRWLTIYSGTGIHDNTKCLLNIHGHEGRTSIEYVD